MQNYLRHKKICNCQISNDNILLKQDFEHSFCEKCGSILLKNINGNINYTIKQKQKQGPYEINPIEIIKTMKKNTEINYPNLNNEFNMSEEELNDVEKANMSIDIYLKYRKMILIVLQKLIKLFDLNDIVFYQCLFYMDYIFSHKMKNEISEKEIIHYLIGYFLCSLKLREIDMGEPPFSCFMSIKEDILISKRKIAYYEILCIKSINYNIYCYSAYDWIFQLIGIGIVFDCEINDSNNIIKINGHRHTIINSINKYALKILLILTLKNVFFKYSPMHIAFSIIQIARERFIDKDLINEELYNKLINLYGIKTDDYKNCYEELKLNISNNFIEKENAEEEKINIRENNINKTKIKKEKFFIEENKSLSSQKKINKFIPFNKSMNQKNLRMQEIKENSDENNLKEEKNKVFINDKNQNQKSKEKIIVADEHINENNKNCDIEYKKNKSRKINHISIDSKKRLFRSHDSLPVIIHKDISNTRKIKESSGINLIKISTDNKDIYNNLLSNATKPKEINLISNLSNKSKSNIKGNKINRILNKIPSTKKNLFQTTTNKLKHQKRNYAYNLGKSNSLLSIDNKVENSKINYTIDLSKKNNDNNKPLKLKQNFKYYLGSRTKMSLISNK